MEIHDKEMVQRVLRGDTKCFESLLQKYWSRLVGFLIKSGLSRPDAEDVSQEAMVKVYQALPKYDDRWEFSTWLYGIAINAFKDFLRKSRKPVVHLDEQCVHNLSPSSHFTEDLILKDELSHMLQLLKEDIRVMVVLHYHNGLTHAEIGRIFRISPGSVKMKLLRAREKMLTHSFKVNESGDCYEMQG